MNAPDYKRSRSRGFRNPMRLADEHADLAAELADLHDHIIDQGQHDCDGIPGGCPVEKVLAKVRAP